jgi:L-threonylcarbamoyladenylate synthase
VERITRVVKVDPASPDPAAIREAADILQAGGLVAFPTETVYGLGADATDAKAVARIYEAKGRPSNNPLIVHGHYAGVVRSAVRKWPLSANRLAREFWPGPLTLVLPRSSIIPDIVTGGNDTVGIRVPDCLVAKRLLGVAARPVAAPSANRSTGISPTRAEHVLKDLDGRIDMILDGGPTPIGIESTVLDLCGDHPRVLRPGAITAAQISRVLNREVETPIIRRAESEEMTSPGQMHRHYAPRTLTALIEPDQLKRYPWPTEKRRFGLMVAGHDAILSGPLPTACVEWLEPAEAARELYDTLHNWDDGALDVIYVVLPPDTEDWRAVRDRLWRATRGWARAGL